MTKKYFFIFFVVFFLIHLLSCKKSNDEVPDFGYDYFPDKVGTYIIYDVDSFSYDIPSAKLDTFKFQLKEKIESIYKDNQNRNTIRLERYVKKHNDAIPYSAMDWQLRNVWAENKTTTTAEKVEDNNRFIKLAFPVKADQKWDGNAQNVIGQLDYSYSYYDKVVKVGNINFSKVLQVKQNDYVSLIDKKYAIEQYASNVGLVYREYIMIESQPSVTLTPTAQAAFLAKPIMERITTGDVYRMTVNSYGIE